MHGCAVACPHRKSKRKKEMNKRQGKAKVREKGRNMKTDITEVRMIGLW